MGNLGLKSGAGFYKKIGKEIQNFDAATGSYVAGGKKASDVVSRMLKKKGLERLQLLRAAEGAEAQFTWSVIREGLHYAATHLATIAETARDVDEAMRWGFAPGGGGRGLGTNSVQTVYTDSAASPVHCAQAKCSPGQAGAGL